MEGKILLLRSDGRYEVLQSDDARRLLSRPYGSQAQQLQQRAATYELLVQLASAGAQIDPRDVSDRAARLLGVVYGSQAQQLLQRAATFELLVQLMSGGAEIDPRAIRALVATDIVTVQSLTQWGGTALTGRNISADLQALTDPAITGILKSIGDIAALENIITRIGETSDAMVAAGAVGSFAAKLRRATQGLEDLKTLIVLGAGGNLIGKVGHDVTGIGDGRKEVTTAGTRVALAASTTAKMVIITAETDNMGVVVVGGVTVVAALATRRGIPLVAGDSVTLAVDNLADVYLDAMVSTEGVTFTYLT